MVDASERGLVKDRIEFALNNVANYLDIVEANLQQAQADQDDDVERWSETLIAMYGDDLETDADVEIIGQHWQMKWGAPDPDASGRPYSPLDDVFPRYLRYSFVALVTLVFESELALLCDWLARKKGLSPLKSGTGTILKPAETFLTVNVKVIAADDLIWRELLDMSTVRNCIAHHGGRLTTFKYGEKLVELSKHKPGLSIVLSRPDEKLLVVDQTYCRNLVELTQEFFRKIFAALESAS